MALRVFALTRTSTDEDAATARAPFAGLADVELIDVSRREASAVIARLGIDAQPAWLYPLGESVIVAVGSPEPIVERLRQQIDRHVEPPAPKERTAPAGAPDVPKTTPVALEAVAVEPVVEESARLTRAQVLELMGERADELHPSTQISRLSRRLNIERPRVTLTKSIKNNEQE